MSLMNGGVGNLTGYLGVGWWFATCTRDENTRWPVFWMGLAALVALVTGEWWGTLEAGVPGEWAAAPGVSRSGST